jgi:hypothetical protein
MFKGFNNKQQNSFPNLNFQMNNSAYGFSGVDFWLDAAFGLNTQTDLGAVSRWSPRIGKSVFEQATAGSQPRLVLNDANFNNLPSVQSQDSSRFMQSPNLYGLSLSTGCTIAVVSKVNTVNVYNGVIGQNTAGRLGIIDGGSTAGVNGFGTVIGATLFQGTTESTNSRIKILTNSNIIVNGVNEFTGTNTAVNYEFDTLFRVLNVTTNSLVGNIAEIIAYNFTMTSAQCIELSNNINTKYALY